jgi:hypothetical protein
MAFPVCSSGLAGGTDSGRGAASSQHTARVMWQDLQRDQVTLSERGCQMIAKQSDHVVPIEQPGIILDAIRSVVDVASGRNDIPVCRS